MKTNEMTREQWFEERRKGLGGSDASVILGVNPWRSAFDLWLEKTGEYIQDVSNEKMYWGNVLEDVVAKEFSKRTGKKVRRKNVMIQHPDHEWMIANVDRVVVGEKAILECKTTSAFNQWDSVPHYYYAQVQHYLAVMNFDMAYLAVLIGGQQYKDFDIPRNDEYIEALIQAEEQFWHLVQTKEPPEMDGSESCSNMLSVKYPSGNGEEIELPADAFKLVQEYESAKEGEKHMKSIKETAANKLKKMIGDNESGFIFDRKVKWSTFTKTDFDSKKLKEEHPEIYENYTQEKTQRRLTVK